MQKPAFGEPRRPIRMGERAASQRDQIAMSLFENAAGRLVPLTEVALEGLTYFLVSLSGHPRAGEIALLAGRLRAELVSRKRSF